MFAVSILLAFGSAKLGILKDAFIDDGGIFKLGSALFGLWLIISSLALIEYRVGIRNDNAIPIMALLAIPISTMAFVIMWPYRHPDVGFWAIIGTTSLIALMSTVAGFGVAFVLIALGQVLERIIYPMFDKMGLSSR